MSAENVLFVDDEPNVLSAYARQLSREFTVKTASSGADGLRVLESDGPFAVVVSDLRMPVMDGVQFLRSVRERAPQTVRMMLTGHADIDAAIKVVNEGNIFRFLTKPCPPADLSVALKAGFEQYRLVTAEKELLEKTLRGSVKMLTDTLCLINPAAFSRASRIRRHVRTMAAELRLPNLWQFELAAMLSQIGCVTVPSTVVEKIHARRPLDVTERKMYTEHPAVGAELLANIPRLEPIAGMIAKQLQPFIVYPDPQTLDSNATVCNIGGQMLKAALDFDDLLVSGARPAQALEAMRRRSADYNPRLLHALAATYLERQKEAAPRHLPLRELEEGMVAAADIYARNGVLLVCKGQEISSVLLTRLRNFSYGVGVDEPLEVV